jgi:hypothetical protein
LRRGFSWSHIPGPRPRSLPFSYVCVFVLQVPGQLHVRYFQQLQPIPVLLQQSHDRVLWRYNESKRGEGGEDGDSMDEHSSSAEPMLFLLTYLVAGAMFSPSAVKSVFLTYCRGTEARRVPFLTMRVPFLTMTSSMPHGGCSKIRVCACWRFACRHAARRGCVFSLYRCFIHFFFAVPIRPPTNWPAPARVCGRFRDALRRRGVLHHYSRPTAAARAAAEFQPVPTAEPALAARR